MGRQHVGAAEVLVDGAIVAGDLLIDDGFVVGVVPSGPGARGLAVAGFIDVQVNGFGGVSFTTADRAGYALAGSAMARHGVTSYLATIPTAAPDAYAPALAEAADAIAAPPPGARPLGLHLEGPFLSPHRPGAHTVAHLRAPDADLLERLVAHAPVAMMTLAPELPGADHLIRSLKNWGIVVSAGHTDADAETANVAFDRGVTMVTHLWNAQRQITSRAPGLAGAALRRSDVFIGVIADLVHLSAETLWLSATAAGDRTVAVTDAAAFAGLAPGTYGDDDHQLTVTDAVRLADGTLAGSAIGLDQAVRNLVAVGIDPIAALSAVTVAPAAVLGRSDIGHLRPGARADVVVLSDDFQIERVLVDGRDAA